LEHPTFDTRTATNHLSFSLLIRPPPISTLFPYTTLFRSARPPMQAGQGGGPVKTNKVTARVALFSVVCWLLWGAGGSAAQGSSSAPEPQGTTETSEIQHDESPPLRGIPPNPPEPGPNHEMRRHPRRDVQTGPDEGYSVVQSSATGIAAAATGVGFEGVGNG